MKEEWMLKLYTVPEILHVKIYCILQAGNSAVWFCPFLAWQQKSHSVDAPIIFTPYVLD